MKKRFSIRLVLPCAGGLLLLTPSMACAMSPANTQLAKPQAADPTTLEQKTPTPIQAPTLHPHINTSPHSGDFQVLQPHNFSTGVMPQKNLTPGEHRTDIQGCLAQKSRPSAKDANSRNVAASPPDNAPEQVLVHTTPGQLTLTHHLRHGCCLQAEVLRKVDKNLITVDVNLSGETCRCMCQSTLQSSFGLKPGEYQVTVQVHDSGQGNTVFDQQVSIPARPKLLRPGQPTQPQQSQPLLLNSAPQPNAN